MTDHPADPVVLFLLAGRRANMDVQLPYLRRILAQHPQVRLHVWNLTQNADDDGYVRGLAGERIAVRNELHGTPLFESWRKVWGHYTGPAYRSTLFVKLDDDVLFIQTATFGAFLRAIRDNPGHLVAADVINNEATTRLTPQLRDAWLALDIPLVAVRYSHAYATAAHRYFLANWRTHCANELEPVETYDYLSINFVGGHHHHITHIAERIGKPAPRVLAGRILRVGAIFVDELAANTLPHKILRGFTVAHLQFAGQGPDRVDDRSQTAPAVDAWRQGYARLRDEYLGPNPG